jgi:AcrR family transcriptional regulator
MPNSTSRQRFVEVATRLFAERGFAATSVADIQGALGLAAGSGALYKHFPSKRALLEEVVGNHVTTMRSGHAEFAAQVPADLEQALGFLADSVWAGMQRDHAVLRVLLRDLDAHPDLLDDVWTAIRGNVYDVFTDWLRTQADAGAIVVDDPEATGAVLLASLTYRPILDTLIGHTPGDIDAARFRTAWVRHALSTLTR